jgi:hypothetical protein
MSLVDIFAIIVLVILIATVVAVFVALGMLPGYIARKRGHPWAEAVSIGGWVTLIFGFVFWPLVMIWAYVDAPAAPARPEARQ